MWTVAGAGAATQEAEEEGAPGTEGGATRGPSGHDAGFGVCTYAHPSARPQAPTKLCVCERLLCTRPGGSGPPGLLLRKPVRPTRGRAQSGEGSQGRPLGLCTSALPQAHGACVWDQAVLATP